MRRPCVYLIGTGPGDPELITLRGLECLRAADVVIHDALVSPRLLAQARAGAELIDVGSAEPGPVAREAIGHLAVEQARENKIVARLRWGDPFVFGRGAEEALFLREHGVPFEVIPGVPAGIGAATYAGIPATMPGGGDTLTLVRAYGDAGGGPPAVDWARVSALGGTVICYAGAHEMPRVIDALRAAGWPDDGRAALVCDGTTPRQETIEDTLAALAHRLREHPRHASAVLVLGRVVELREHLRWFDERPLFGRRVLVTRPREQAADLAERLAALGADPVVAPMIRIAPPEDPAPLRRAAAGAGAFDYIILTSTNAVDAFMSALLEGGRDVRALAGPLLCAVGPGTAGRLARYGIRADLVPEEFRAEALLSALLQRGIAPGATVLLPRADIARDLIAAGLRQAGAGVTEVVAYRTIADESVRDGGEPDVYRMLLDGRLDAVTFTSASAIRSFARAFGEEQAADLLAHTVVATIGPVAAEAARRLGITVTVQPAASTIAALVDAIAAHFAGAPR